MKIVLGDELQSLLLLSSLSDNWETLVVSLSSSLPNGVLSLLVVKIVCTMKRLEKKIWLLMLYKLELQGGVRVSNMKDILGLSTSYSQKKIELAIIVVKRGL